MKRMFVLLALCGAAVAFGGNFENPERMRSIMAEKAIAKDPKAGVSWSTVTNDLLQVSQAIDAIDLSTIDPSQWTAPQRAEIQDIKSALQSLKQAVKNLEQADSKMVRKIQKTEEIRAGAQGSK
jgi:hypothetical protein